MAKTYTGRFTAVQAVAHEWVQSNRRLIVGSYIHSASLGLVYNVDLASTNSAFCLKCLVSYLQ